MKKKKLFGLLFAALVVGGYLGGLMTARAMGRLQFAKPEVDMAFLTSQKSQWAAFLRLGETTNAIADLEKTTGIQLDSIASWESVAPQDVQTRKKVDGFLTDAKTYQKSYPIAGANTPRVAALFASVPDRDPHSHCTTEVCRLDDLRLAKLPASSNAP